MLCAEITVQSSAFAPQQLRSSSRVLTLCILLLLFAPTVHAPGFPGGSVVKNLPAMYETWVQSLGWEDPLEKEMATHSGILAQLESPQTEEPTGAWE